MKKKIEDATATELAHFAENVMNLPNINHRQGKETLIEKIRAAGHDSDHILTPDAAPDETEDNDETDAAEMVFKSGQRIKIKIPQTEGPGGKHPVSVSVEGKAMSIPRDKAVIIDAEYMEALTLATETRYPNATDEDLGDGVDMPSYAVQFLGLA